MSNPIVNVKVTQVKAPTPSVLQKSGTFVSQGATITSPGTYSLLTQFADLTPLLAGAKTLATLSYSGGTVTGTASSPHGWPTNDVIEVVIAGAAPAAYNGIFLATVTGATTFTYTLPSNPGSNTAPGIVTIEDVQELVAMATTFFAQGAALAVWVFECGTGSASDGATFLNTWIQSNPGIFYGFLVPRYWDGNPVFLTMLGNYNATTSKTYFWVTTTLATYKLYSATMKCVDAMIECPAYGAWSANALTAISFAGQWGSNALTAISWGAATQTVTATTTTAHSVQPGQFFTITGCTPAGYNGTFLALAGTTGSTLVYGLATNPGNESVLGSLSASVVGSVTATTNSAHGVLPGQYFSIAGVTPSGYNGTFLAQLGTTGSTLVYSLPASPGGETVLGMLVGSQYSSAGIPVTEFSHASDFWTTLNYSPSSTNRVTPLNLSFLNGVTPFPTQGNQALLTTLNNANINVVGTGAAGGISSTILIGGDMLDGNPFNYWYSVDWAQINGALSVNNALINGANNPQNPLDYNQPGINALQQVLTTTMSNGISYGLVLNPIKQLTLSGPDFAAALDAGTYNGFTIVNADPFANYVNENQNDYASGIYNGLSVDYVPLRGFESITINIAVSTFAA